MRNDDENEEMNQGLYIQKKKKARWIHISRFEASPVGSSSAHGLIYCSWVCTRKFTRNSLLLHSIDLLHFSLALSQRGT